MDKGILFSAGASLVKIIAPADLELTLSFGNCAFQKYILRCLCLHAIGFESYQLQLQAELEFCPHGCKSKQSSESSLGSKSKWFDLHGELCVCVKAAKFPRLPSPPEISFTGPGAQAQSGGCDLNVLCYSCCSGPWSLLLVSLHFTASESPCAC